MREYANGKHVGEDWNFRRGDIYVANLNPFRGSEQGGTRPVLVLQNNAGNFFAPTLVIAPITSRMDKKGRRTHFLLLKQKGLLLPSYVTLEQIRTIDKNRIRTYLGHIPDDRMRQIDEIICYELGIQVREDVEAP